MSEFVLKNEEGKKLLELSVSSAFDKSAIIKFLDLNRMDTWIFSFWKRKAQ